MAEGIKVGDKIPAFVVKDHEGYDVRDDDIIGTPMVIYFYPKDDTPGCTEEACEFRDSMRKFDMMQTLLLGVSPDSAKAHKEFIQKNKLEFSLLSDEKKDLCRLFGVLDKDGNVIRTTFAINSRGIVEWMEKPVDVKGHTERVLKAVEKHCKEDIITFDDFRKDYEEFLKDSLGSGKNDKNKSDKK